MPNYNSTLQSNNTDLQAILNTINELPEAGGVDPVLQDKTITPTTSKQTVTADSGYDGLDTVTVNAMPTATQATPAITVNASGLITATATQTAGYVAAGSKSATKQLAFQAAKTITPNTASQIAVSSGYYTGGNITVAAVPTQSKTITPTSSAQNITPDSGKFLSKVTVNAIPSSYIQPTGTKTVTTNGIHDVKSYASVNVSVASSGGDTSVEDSLVTRTLTSYMNDRVTTIGSYAFFSYTRLTTVSFPAATTIGSSAFYSCTRLTTVSFPAAKTIGSGAFYCCSSLTTVSFPAATTISNYAFYDCSRLSTVSFPAVTTIGNTAFYYCSSLTTVSFPAATTIGSSAFSYCTRLTTVSFPAAITISNYAFRSCYNLTSLYLTGSSVCKLSNSNAFSSTPIGGYSTLAGTYGSIYVPTSLLTSYKKATNWTYFSSRFVGI